MRFASVALLAMPLLPVLVSNSAGAQAADTAMQTKQSHARPPKAKPASKSAGNAPLTGRERAVQLLNRFTFGARPGEVEQVLSMGAGKWFEQQLSPETIKDDVLNRRLNDYPTLNMTPEQALTLFPDRGTIQAVANEKTKPPT